jgi:hypothetical protein
MLARIEEDDGCGLVDLRHHVQQHGGFSPEGGHNRGAAREVAQHGCEKLLSLQPRIGLEDGPVHLGLPGVRLFEPGLGVGVALGPDLGLGAAAEQPALIGQRHLA